MTAVDSNFLFPAGTFLVFALVAIAFTGVWIWSLVDALRFDDRRWIEAGQSKILWVLLLVFLGLLGSILYVVMCRPSLGRTQPLPI